MKNRGDEATYADCDVHAPAWAKVQPDFDVVEGPTRVFLDLEDLDGVLVLGIIYLTPR